MDKTTRFGALLIFTALFLFAVPVSAQLNEEAIEFDEHLGEYLP
ncbi:MAG: hypothetical protein ACI9UK_002400, partial [Candidatus Krumholzibacteriia bacterium]